MKCALIGKPLGHSYSKEIHALVADYDYDLVELDETEVAPYLKKRDFDGINVTIPYKQTVMPYLDEISDEAKRIGAVNTIVNRGGRLVGYNTDFAGMSALIKKNDICVNGKTALVLGTGGTSKTACEVLKSLGASQVLKVSRTPKNGAIDYDAAITTYDYAQIIVNTTPVGMYPHEDEQPIDLSNFKNLEGVVDAIYHPLCTNLVLQAKAAGVKVCGGLYMLVAQAVYASSLFRNVQADSSSIDRVYDEISRQKRNVVLIGMPSSGKSTVGAELAKACGMEFIDTDAEVERKAGVKIADIFADCGEAAFRKMESEEISRAARNTHSVIATGGGAVLNEKNVNALSRNGIIVFLDRSLDKLVATSDRPLSSDRKVLEELYAKRYPIYKKCADVCVNADGDVENVVSLIRRDAKI